MNRPISRQSPKRGTASSSPFRSGPAGRICGKMPSESIVPEKTILKRFPTNVDVPLAVVLEKQRAAMMDAMKSETGISSGRDAAAAKLVVAVCKECVAAKEEGRGDDFHLCVLDPVVGGFRTPAGFVQRPLKKHLGA